MDILIIPDSHCRPGEDNLTRFAALGNYLVHNQPEIIVDLGDHFDMSCLSRFDEGLEAMEGQRYDEDIEAGKEALDTLQGVMDVYNKGRKKRYDPRKYFLEGNHEIRQEAFLKKNPKFRGTIGFHSFGLEERGWEVTRFKQKLFLEGFVFMHYFENKMGKPLASGVNVGNAIINKMHVSGWQGHNHELQLSFQTGADGRRYMAGSLGWFGALDQVEGYAEATMFTWWNGLTVLHDITGQGYGDLESISQERLLRDYAE